MRLSQVEADYGYRFVTAVRPLDTVGGPSATACRRRPILRGKVSHIEGDQRDAARGREVHRAELPRNSRTTGGGGLGGVAGCWRVLGGLWGFGLIE